MPFDAQGNFTRVMNWQEDAANNIPILANRHDDEDDNFAAGFNETFCRDGRAAATGNFKMGGNKIVNLATGTNTGDAVNKGQMDTAINTAVTGKQNTITGGASTITSANLTLNRALVSNGSGKVSVSNTTSTELGYVHGVTSAIQTQIDSKQATITGGASTIASSNLTASRALTSNSSGKVAVSSTTDTELGYIHGVTSAIQTQINGKQATLTGAATTIASSNLTASKALISNSSGKVAVSSTTDTELGYVHGVTSAIQTQINGKQATITGAATTITGSDLTASRALVSNSSGKVAVSSTTSTELGYVHGVTSNIQTQINNVSASIATAISTMLSTLYPVNSVYLGVQSTCPLATLISGSTWTKVATKVVTDVSSTVSVKGTGKTLGLTNGSANVGIVGKNSWDANSRIFSTTAYNKNVTTTVGDAEQNEGWFGVVTDATKSGLTGTATSTTLTLNIWKRTA